MLKNHPKGLLVAFFANMGERFGYYTMLAVFVYYLQAKFGFSTEEAGHYYGGFLFGIYFLPLLGGWVADKFLGYGKTILLGIIILFLGYLLMAIPDRGLGLIIVALTVISLGTGFFKGNLQALVGNMYDDPRYDKNRDNAFNIFYMGINIGAFFAPSAATAASNFILKSKGLVYDPKILDYSHAVLKNNLANADALKSFGIEHLGANFTNITEFAKFYIDSVAQSYNAAFGVAAASMIISLIIFVAFKKYYKDADLTEKQKAASEEHKDKVVELTPEQTRERMTALGLVFFVVIFFWMAFHQNGFTLSVFAKNYTEFTVSKITYIFFDLKAFLPLLMTIIGLIVLFRKNLSNAWRGVGAAMVVGFGLLTYYVVQGFDEQMAIAPQKFQHFNPIFIVFLTPVIVSFFTWLRSKGKEPSAPKKIGIGMIITGIGFMVMILASMGLLSPRELNDGVSPMLRSPYWLIGTYFTLTIAELFLSPMGISFVSKVAPPKYKGLMQGGWLGATAIGNLLAGLIGIFWDKLELWQFFAILVVMSWLSATFIFAIMRKLENATK
ncbi:peptide MFS transporter [Tenuifilum thalassicum]|uniref:Peptide MFS transporter n=1 Tax=Tenuifilum thalassicum TaxID=2590900 RepID=A0A7D3XU42_9BACT|nr:peptide MFS transporter [Tenuifilum thalassicum]QKG79331.1 peptide MFS transporter [Tenuifilum thalassicum]